MLIEFSNEISKTNIINIIKKEIKREIKGISWNKSTLSSLFLRILKITLLIIIDNLVFEKNLSLYLVGTYPNLLGNSPKVNITNNMKFANNNLYIYITLYVKKSILEQNQLIRFNKTLFAIY